MGGRWQRILNPITVLDLTLQKMAQTIKNLPVMQKTQVQHLGQEEPLEKEMATHFSIPAWRIPRTKEPGRLQSMGHKESDTTERLTLSLFIENEGPSENFCANEWRGPVS